MERKTPNFKKYHPDPQGDRAATTLLPQTRSKGSLLPSGLKERRHNPRSLKKATCPRLRHPIRKIISQPIAKTLATPQLINIPMRAGLGKKTGKKNKNRIRKNPLGYAFSEIHIPLLITPVGLKRKTAITIRNEITSATGPR